MWGSENQFHLYLCNFIKEGKCSTADPWRLLRVAIAFLMPILFGWCLKKGSNARLQVAIATNGILARDHECIFEPAQDSIISAQSKKMDPTPHNDQKLLILILIPRKAKVPSKNGFLTKKSLFFRPQLQEHLYHDRQRRRRHRRRDRGLHQGRRNAMRQPAIPLPEGKCRVPHFNAMCTMCTLGNSKDFWLLWLRVYFFSTLTH